MSKFMNTTNINVLYIITKLELGGAQKVCLSLVRGLQKAGANAILISGTQGKLVNQAKELSNVILIDNLKREISFNLLFHEIKSFIILIKQIRKLKKIYPNLIVHTHSTKAGIIGRWAALFAGIKIRIHTIHGYAFHSHQNKIKWAIIYIFELFASVITTHFVCVSSEDVKTGIKLFPKFSKKYSIIRAAVDYNKFAKFNVATKTNDQKFIFGTVACFKKQKNLFDLLKAFEIAHTKNKNCFLEIIGDGDLRNEIEQWIAEHNIQHNVTLHGWQHNVAEIMLNWNAFVLSSLWEGLPCAVIEARLLKLPVLAYNTGGIHDVIIQGKNGFLYQQGDWQEMANGMLKILDDKNLYQNLQNYTEDLTEFHNAKMVKKHIELYQKL